MDNLPELKKKADIVDVHWVQQTRSIAFELLLGTWLIYSHGMPLSPSLI
jgi:hypothetical protein